MSSTNVHSKKSNSTVSIAGSAFKATEKTLEIPPKAQVFEIIPSYVEEQGNIEIPAGDAYVNNRNEMVKADRTTCKMKDSKAFDEISKHKNQKDKMKMEALKVKRNEEHTI